MDKILPKIDEATKSLPEIGVQTIVAALTHDVDNAEGLWVTNDLGQKWQTFGDSHGGVVAPVKPEQADTKKHVEEAVRLGVADIQHAYAVDANASDEETQSQVRRQTSSPAIAGQPKYGPEQLMPYPDPAAQNGVQGWKQPDFQTLWSARVRSDRSDTYGQKITESIHKGDFGDQLKKLAAKFPDVETAPGWSHVHPRAAYQNSFLPEMQNQPRAKIQQVLDYDPGRGQANSRTDDATREDIDRLEGQDQAAVAAHQDGAALHKRLRGLTLTERVYYARNLESWRGHTTSDNEQDKIVLIFETASPSDRRALFYALEGHAWDGDLESGVFHYDNLDKNLDHAHTVQLKQLLDAS